MGRWSNHPPWPGRFWSRFVRDGECLLWTGYCDRKTGYGMVSCPGGKQMTAHRLAYTLAKGPVPTGLCVLHKCDRRPCGEPSHLFVGTRLDNMRDAVAKGRIAWGERVRHAKLLAADVEEIRRRYAAGARQAVLADVFGVTVGAIRQVVQGRNWRALTGGVPVTKDYGSKGEDNPLAKLTAASVQAIRAAYPNKTQSALAIEYGVSASAVQLVLCRKAWKHI